METSGILKNYDKFEVLKRASGINLKQYNFTYRAPEPYTSSTSIRKYKDFWFELPSGKGIFKTFDSGYNRELKDIRIINELLCMELCSQIDINHALYQPAHFEKDYGLISYNIVGENQKMVTLAQFLSYDNGLSNNLLDIVEALDYYEQQGYVINKDQIVFDIFKLLVIDALTMQTDRNNFNINFIFNQSTLEISVAPLFDNEYAFCMELAKFIYENEEDKTFDSFVKKFSHDAKMLNVENENYYNENAYYNNVKNLVNLAKSNKQMYEFLQNALKNLNIEAAINQVESLGYIISPEYKLYITNVIQHTKELFEKELASPTTEETTYLYDEFIK